MPGRGALLDMSGALADIKSIQMPGNPAGAGDHIGEYSEIGGDGRRGSDAYGMLQDPMFTRIDGELVGKAEAGLATKGEQGVGGDGTEADYKSSRNAQGRVFHGGGSRRRED